MCLVYMFLCRRVRTMKGTARLVAQSGSQRLPRPAIENDGSGTRPLGWDLRRPPNVMPVYASLWDISFISIYIVISSSIIKTHDRPPS